MLSNSRVSVGFKMIGGYSLLPRNERKVAEFTVSIALASLGPILVKVFTEFVSDVHGVRYCFAMGFK